MNKCIHFNCKNIAQYNFEDETYFIYCINHKLPNMTNKICKNIDCGTLCDEKYEDYCHICYIHSFYNNII